MRTLCVVLLLAAAPALAKPPKLTLFISVDAMGTEVLLQNRRNFRAGLAQTLKDGAFFPNARYEYAEPVTAVGHATLVSGANPWRHGVVSNRVLNRETGKSAHIFADPDHPVLEAPPSDEDVSPLNLIAETLADRLRLSTAMRGKAISISGKSRSAIAMAGRLGTAWWYHPGVGKFVTGTWYVKEFPAWVKAFNEKKPADAWFGKTWTLAMPAAAYVGEDDRPWEADYYGMGRTFPKPLTGGRSSPGLEYYKALNNSPVMIDVLTQMARAAIEGEGLGKDAHPDALFVGFSPVDYVYHHFGPDSWEMQDMMVRLDRAIATLINAAEKAAGKGNVLVVITADHGGAAIPEAWSAAGLPAARVDPAALHKGLNDALKKQFGIAPVLYVDEVDIYLDDRAIANKKLDGATVRAAAAQWLREHPSVMLAIPRDDLFSENAAGQWLPALRAGYFPGRSGDVLMIVRQYHVISDVPTGTSHGTPYTYDSQVPVILWGRGVRPGQYPQQISPTQVAPTVTTLWETLAPAMSEGAPLSDALSGK